jgi:hypothetical protein
MASIISADNGSISGSAGLKTSSDASGILQLQTGANVNALQIDASQYVSATVNGLGRGLIPAEQYYELNTALAGANVTTAQNWLGVGVSLVANTVYQFEGEFALIKTAGTVSHTLGIGFGGTVGVNNILYMAMNYSDNTSSLTTAGINNSTMYIQTVANTTLIAALATATQAKGIFIRGTISVSTAGTFIPQYTLSAAPGGAYTTQIGSYFKISPLSLSGSNTSIGTWA